MPRYEYQCNKCSSVAEQMRPVAERRYTMPCPNCAEGEMELAPSLTAFALKGGGWTGKSSLAAPPAAKKPLRGYDMTGSRND